MPVIRNGLVLANLMRGTSQIAFVKRGTVQIWANELVIVLGNSSNLVLKTVVEAAKPGAWADRYLKKRVVVPAGVEIKATVNAYAILATLQADGLAGSWAGSLTLEVRGTVSGIGGTANSGVGGTVVNVNFSGRNGEKLQINLIGGTFRAGGGGGGRAGNGGMGVWYSARTIAEYPPRSDDRWANGFDGSGDGISVIYWNGIAIFSVRDPYYNITSTPFGGWTYYRGGTHPLGLGYSVYRQVVVYDVPNYTSGGVSGNAGRGQGCDGAAAVGAAAVAGGTNAGASGKSGDGAAYGGTGQTGANGSTGNYTGGTAGAAGGLPGFYLTGAANSNFTNTGGTLLGRLAS